MDITGSKRFVNRQHELAQLHRGVERATPALILVYGRRRVGKTFLLDHAWSGRRIFYFLASNSTDGMNRTELLHDLSRWSGRDLEPRDYPTWRTIFRLLVDLADEGSLIVVLDEFQYLLNRSNDDIASQLVSVWDREVQDRPLTLVLSGSEVATMEQLTAGSQPLFGRFALRMKILPLDYYDARQMVPDSSLREAATLYGALGGMPRYLAAVDSSETMAETLIRTMLLPSGEVHLQIEHLIEQEQGIRNPAEYQAVLAAIAGGATRVNEIAQTAGLDVFATRHALETLERLELIWRERNFAAPARAPYQHRIADNAVRFWYRFVNPNRSPLATSNGQAVWQERVAPFLDSYMGKVFERMCAAAYRRFHQQWILPSAVAWERWEGQDRNRRPIELDIVARLDDGRMLTGEIKWSSQPVDDVVHRDLRRDLEDLSRSGQGWAHEALSGPHIYFSAAGFMDRFRTLAAQEGNIYLITLEEMYNTHAE
jgi:uncharacterized protein